MPPADRHFEGDLRQALRVLRRRKFVIAGVVVVVLGVALSLSFSERKQYQSAAVLLLQPRDSETLFNPSTGQRGDPIRAVYTEIQVLYSKPVHDMVRAKLGYDATIAAVPGGNADVIYVKGRSPSPAAAAAIPNAYAEAYIAYKRSAAVDDLAAASKTIQDKITDLQAQLRTLDTQIATQGRNVDEQLSSQRDSLVQQVTTFRSQLSNLQLSSSLNSGGAHLVTPAAVPTTPSSPRPARTGVAAGFVGLLLGLALAFVVDFFDDSLETEADVVQALGPVPLIGRIPAVTSWKDRDQAVVVARTEPNSAAAEAYRSLRTSLHFTSLDRPLKVIQITSPGAGEGKTTTVANLGVAMARAGSRVVIAGCDLRWPRIHAFFGMANTIGFTSVLLGEALPAEALQRVKGEDHLYVLASGPPPPNPSEMLSSTRADAKFTTLRAEADVVIVDSPPVRSVTDAAVLSGRADATIIVIMANKTTRTQLRQAIDALRQVDAPIIGAVLNGISRDEDGLDTYDLPVLTTTDASTNGHRPRRFRRAKATKQA